MAITKTRRLVPLLIATSLTTGAIALTTTSALAAPSAAPAGVTTDSDNPLLNRLSKIGNLGKIGKIGPVGSNSANGGDTQPPSGGPDPRNGGLAWGKDPNTAPVDIPPFVVMESRTDDARRGPIMDDSHPGSIRKSVDPGKIERPKSGEGGEGLPGANGGAVPKSGEGGQTIPDGNTDPGPRQDSDYGIWTNPDPGPIVN
ncbi:hypothetical protein ACFVFI_30340 [Streptomyces sp. NPDC057705]|uniref:hypothetical protein n=1 Tax=Streptomyces sp. NPDC057705 TaxID=3346222 RepID=UPI003683A2B4